MIPGELRATLGRFLPGDDGLWEGTTLLFSNRTALRGYRALAPIAWWPLRGFAPRWVTGRRLPHGMQKLEVVGVSIPGRIMLGIPRVELATAAGLSLVAHEMVHQEQYRTIPNFEGVYEQADQASDPEHPWENPYEYPAYVKEREVYCALVKEGVPGGGWIPLGVQLWGCPVAW